MTHDRPERGEIPAPAVGSTGPVPPIDFAGILADTIIDDPHRLGWCGEFERAAKAWRQRGCEVGLVLSDYGISAEVLTLEGEVVEAAPSGRLLHEVRRRAELGCVGDWVALREAPGEERLDCLIEGVLPRRSVFSRKVPGKSTEEQVLAANIDCVVLVTDPVHDWNLRRMERYAALAGRGRGRLVVVLNKVDLAGAEILAARFAELDRLGVPEADRYLASARSGAGLERLRELFAPGVVATLLGSSGVGKSSLINRLFGEELLETGEIHEPSGQGKHTTTARRVLLLPQGALLIDNPGIREVQLWTDPATLRESFADVAEIAARCQFSNCKHQGDRGCALAAAVRAGELALDRVESFLNLDDEIARLEKQQQGWKRNFERALKRELRAKFRNRADRFYDPLGQDEGE